MNAPKPKSTIRIVRPPLSRTFDVPLRDDLLQVFEGDSVKLIFEGDQDMERMWVTVTRSGAMDEWSGNLDNEPVLPGVMDRIAYGDMVTFHPYDVIDIMLHHRTDQLKAEGEVSDPSDTPSNTIRRPWYKNSQIITTIVVVVIGAIATIVAALL